jgi:hypothetical protein
MRIDRIEIEKLCGHPDNANRMDEKTFDKLCAHIERAGRYEPIVVRPAPGREGFYQILNGHHRTKALGRLGFLHADCVVWDVDDAQATLLLATLNRLCGKDIPALRAKLLGSLAQSFGTESLEHLLAESSAAIAKTLSSLSGRAKKPAPLLEPMTFFLDAEQKQIVLDALNKAAKGFEELNRTQKRVAGLVHIARYYIGKEMFEK